MEDVIDLGSEILVDQSTVRNPYVRLLASALGETLVRGSSWVAIEKRALARFERSATGSRHPSTIGGRHGLAQGL